MAGIQDGSIQDRQLVANFLLHREEWTFREIYRRHAPSVNQMIVRCVGGFNGDAEDVIQATWIRAVENLAGFRWESTLRTWLTGIALNCSREHLRKLKRTRTFELIESMDHAHAPKITHEINRIDLERAIASLPDGYREVLILHDIEGYTHDEIGDLLGIETGTSKSQLSRARKAVRMILSIKEGNRNDGKAGKRTEQRRARGIPRISGDAISFSR